MQAGYNLSAALKLVGRLDADALERALATIVERHHILRTVYASEDGEGVCTPRIELGEPCAPEDFLNCKSPFEGGYGPLTQHERYFGIANLGQGLDRYGRWLEGHEISGARAPAPTQATTVFPRAGWAL